MSRGGGALTSAAHAAGGVSNTPDRLSGLRASVLISLILTGRTFSGNETNCVFMSTGGGRFADVSHAIGFNAPDDGRALMRTDWDQDGDLDFWMVNRSGPAVRFFRNETPTTNRSVMLLLEGTRSNRDAIGARVHMTLHTGADGTLTRTVRAGDGFLSQSTRWLHFGLGAASRPQAVTVRWPSGRTEEFRGIDQPGRYRVVEGTGAAELLGTVDRSIRLAELPLGRERTTDAVATVLTSRLPAPQLAFVDESGGAVDLESVHEGPILLNLWASWCPPCVGELQEFTREEARLRDAGIEVVALTLDSISADDGSDPAEAAALLEKIRFPFTSGRATTETVHKLERAHAVMFHQPITLPVPTSFLIDHEGRIAAVYRGVVGVDRVIADVATVHSGLDAVRMASVPMRGIGQSRQICSLRKLHLSQSPFGTQPGEVA